VRGCFWAQLQQTTGHLRTRAVAAAGTSQHSSYRDVYLGIQTVQLNSVTWPWAVHEVCSFQSGLLPRRSMLGCRSALAINITGSYSNGACFSAGSCAVLSACIAASTYHHIWSTLCAPVCFEAACGLLSTGANPRCLLPFLLQVTVISWPSPSCWILLLVSPGQPTSSYKPWV
jgi:hypothetical protein